MTFEKFCDNILHVTFEPGSHTEAYARSVWLTVKTCAHNIACEERDTALKQGWAQFDNSGKVAERIRKEI